MNGSTEARAVSGIDAFPTTPTLACSCKKSPASPDLARELSVPENEVSVVPQVPLLQTAARVAVPTAPVWIVNAANALESDVSVPVADRLVRIRIGTVSPRLPPVT